jgi:IPT/TIG domain
MEGDVGAKLVWLAVTGAIVAACSGVSAGSALGSVDFGSSPNGTLSLPAGHGVYLFAGGVSGDTMMSAVSWSTGQDLAVTQPTAGGQVISIGHTTQSTGSFASSAAAQALVGVGLDGYVVAQSYSAQKLGKAKPKATKPPGKALKGPRVTLSFKTTSPDQIVVALAGGQSVGEVEESGLELTGSEASTTGETGTSAIASAAAYTGRLPVGKHKVKFASTTYSPNTGSALGVVLYVLSPAPAPVVSSVSPSSGPETGGTKVTITGSDLDGDSAVSFGGTAAESFTALSPTEIEAVSPPGSGTVDVTVSTERGVSRISPADEFGFLAPHAVNAYDNYSPTTELGHLMCRGNPGRPESIPGGTVTQTFTVPAGVASLSSAEVNIDPDATVTAHMSLTINGVVRAATQAAAAGDTFFSWPAVPVSAGDQAALSISFTATFGKLIAVYSAAPVGGTFTFSNSCSDGAQSGSIANGLRAVVSGLSP